MNNEEKILAALEKVSGEIAELKAGQVRLEAKVDSIKKDTGAVFEQTADLAEFKTEITQKVDDLLTVTKENTFDIVKMKAKRA